MPLTQSHSESLGVMSGLVLETVLVKALLSDSYCHRWP